MAVSYTWDRTKLDALVARLRTLDGQSVLFGQPGPAPLHRGKGGRGSKVTTAFTLAVVEFGLPKSRKRASPGRRKAPRKGWAKRARLWLGRLLRSFSGRRVSSRSKKPPTPTISRERPVIRWVAAVRRDVMRRGFRRAVGLAVKRKDPRPALEAMGDDLVKILEERLRAVGGVDTGHTLETLGYKIARRDA